jgi:hypothetical protein
MLKAPVPLNKKTIASPTGIDDNSGNENISMPEQWGISEHDMDVVPSVDFDEVKVLRAKDSLRADIDTRFGHLFSVLPENMNAEEQFQYGFDPSFANIPDDFAFQTAKSLLERRKEYVSKFKNDSGSLREFDKFFNKEFERLIHRASILQVSKIQNRNAQQKVEIFNRLFDSIMQSPRDWERLREGMDEIGRWHHVLPSYLPGDKPVQQQITEDQEELIKNAVNRHLSNKDGHSAEWLLKNAKDSLSPEAHQDLERRLNALKNVTRNDDLYKHMSEEFGDDYDRAIEALDDVHYTGSRYMTEEENAFLKARFEADKAERDRQRREAVLVKQDQIHGTLLKLALDGKLDTWAIRNAGLNNEEQRDWFIKKSAMDERLARTQGVPLNKFDEFAEKAAIAGLIECKYGKALNVNHLKEALPFLSKSEQEKWYQELIELRESGDSDRDRLAGHFDRINTIVKMLYWDRPEQYSDYIIMLENDFAKKGVSLNSLEGCQKAMNFFLERAPTALQKDTSIGGRPDIWPSGIGKQALVELLQIPPADLDIIQRRLIVLEKPISTLNVLHVYQQVKGEGDSAQPDWSRMDGLDPSELHGWPLIPADQFVAGVNSNYGDLRGSINAGSAYMRRAASNQTSLPYVVRRHKRAIVDFGKLHDADPELFANYVAVLSGNLDPEELDIEKVGAIDPGAVELFDAVRHRKLGPGERVFHPFLIPNELRDSPKRPGIFEWGYDFETNKEALLSFGGTIDGYNRRKKSFDTLHNIPDPMAHEMDAGLYMMLRAAKEIIEHPDRQRPQELRGNFWAHAGNLSRLLPYIARETGEYWKLSLASMAAGKGVSFAADSAIAGFAAARAISGAGKAMDTFRKIDKRVGSEVEAARVYMSLAVTTKCFEKIRFFSDVNNNSDEVINRMTELLVNDETLRRSFSEAIRQTTGRLIFPVGEEELPDGEITEPANIESESNKIRQAASDFAKIFYQKNSDLLSHWSERTFVETFSNAAVDWYADFHSGKGRPRAISNVDKSGRLQSPLPVDTSIPANHESPQLIP